MITNYSRVSYIKKLPKSVQSPTAAFASKKSESFRKDFYKSGIMDPMILVR